MKPLTIVVIILYNVGIDQDQVSHVTAVRSSSKVIVRA